jgi:hypothetical protein
VNLSIAAIVKDEASSLLEWVAFHRVMGAHHFFLADNESTDGTTELLQRLESLGIVTRFAFPTPINGNAQMPAYSLLLEHARGACDVVAFIDADEFMLPTDDAPSLLPFLERHFSDPDVSAVGLNWANFGSSHELFAGEGLVIDRFTCRAKRLFGVHHHIKTMARPERIIEMVNPHYAKLKSGRYLYSNGNDIDDHPRHGRGLTRHISWSGARINHYATKSLEEFLLGKSRRGSATKKSRVKHKSYFIRHDRNEESCLLARRFVPAVIQEMDRLREWMGRPQAERDAPIAEAKARGAAFTLRRFLRDAMSAK